MIFNERNILKQLAVFKVEIFRRALFPHSARALVFSDVPDSQFSVQQSGICSLRGSLKSTLIARAARIRPSGHGRDELPTPSSAAIVHSGTACYCF